MEKAYKLEFNHKKTGSLFLNCCGCSKTEPLHSFGPAVRPHYLIHYVLSGKGSFTIGEKNYPLEEGYGFLIEPGKLTFYQADDREPWTYVWVGFSGAEAGEQVHNMGLSLNHPIFKCDKGEGLYAIVLDMMKHNTFGVANDLKRNGLLHIFLSVIADSALVQEKSETDKANIYVQKAIEFILNNYYNPIKVTDVADYVCINRSYLYTLFQEYIKMSPQQFLAAFRINKATELLLVSDFSVESIALSCGYNDALVFTKAFKHRKGMSPSAFRKEMIHRGERHRKEILEQLETFINECGTPI